MTLTIDHLMWVCSDLQEGCNILRQQFDQLPRAGGSHVGRGTRNALLSFADDTYLEILAPDPEQPLARTQGATLARLNRPRLETFCCRGVSLGELAERARLAGLDAEGPVDYQRRRPDGVLLQWQLLFLRGHDFGGLLPFFIDWCDAPHPAAEEPSDFDLAGVQASTPRAEELNRLVSALALPMDVREGNQDSLTAVLRQREDGREVVLS